MWGYVVLSLGGLLGLLAATSFNLGSVAVIASVSIIAVGLLGVLTLLGHKFQ